MKKYLLLFLSITLFNANQCFSQTLGIEIVAHRIKGKTVNVVIPNEKEKIYIRMMEAIKDKWKISKYKFISPDAAEKLQNSNDNIFLQFGTVTYVSGVANGQKVSEFGLLLLQGRMFSKITTPKILYKYSFSNAFENVPSSANEDQIPEGIQERIYFHICRMIWELKREKTTELTSLNSCKDGIVEYFGKKTALSKTKAKVATKTLILGGSEGSEYEARVKKIKDNLKMPGLKVNRVDTYEELEAALKKGDKHSMVDLLGIAYTCDECEPLFLIPDLPDTLVAANKNLKRKIMLIAIPTITVAIAGLITLIVLAFR